MKDIYFLIWPYMALYGLSFLFSHMLDQLFVSSFNISLQELIKRDQQLNTECEWGSIANISVE